MPDTDTTDKNPNIEILKRSELESKMSEIVESAWKDLGLPEIKEQLEAMAATQKTHLAAINQTATKTHEKGTAAAQVVRALVASQVHKVAPIDWARKAFGDDSPAVAHFEKALAAGVESAGGFLLREEMSREIIELLRPASAVTSMNPRFVPLSGTLTFPKHTAGSSGGWIGENQNAPATQPAFGQVIMTPKKYASLVPISNDLTRRDGGEDADNFVRDDLVGDVAAALDIAYIRADGTNGQPKGLRHWGVGTAVNGTVNLVNVTTDLASCIQRMGDADVTMSRLGWVMEWRTWRYLATLRDSNGHLAFGDEMRTGNLFGIPFVRTSQIPRNLGGSSDETEIFLVDFADVVVGQATDIMLDVTTSGAYHDGSNVVAAFSLDQSVIRAIVEVDLIVRHADSVQILTAVDWT